MERPARRTRTSRRSTSSRTRVSGRVFQGFTAPVLDDRGGFLGRIWTLREVTQQRELDRLKDDFVATVSHELRTPLTSMMGFLEMIREGEAGELNEEQQRFLAIVYRSSERLQRLVGDLLFVARLDANGLQLQFGDVDARRDRARRGRVVGGARPLARDRPASPSSMQVPPVTRRQGAALAARRQPDLERAQVHARGRYASSARAFVDGGAGGRRGRGHGHRDPAGRAEPALPALLPLVDRDRAGDPRHGPRPRDLAGDRRGARRHDRRALGSPARGRASASSSRSSRKRSPPDAARRARRRLVVGPRGRLRRGRRRGARRRAPRRTTSSTPTSLVDACRAVLAQVGEGDALAISCFWHSLVAVDEHDRPLTPVLTWRDLAAASRRRSTPRRYHRRTGCFLHPAYWPAKIERLAREGVDAARYLSFGDYLLLRLDRRGAHERLDGERHRSLRPERARLGRRDARCARARPRRSSPPLSDEPVAGVWPALGDGACSNVGAGCTDARPRRGDGRHVGGGARRLRRGRGGAAAGPLSLPARRAPVLRRRRALGRRQPARVARCARCATSTRPALAERPPAAHGLTLPAVPRRRAVARLGPATGAARSTGLTFATTPLDIAQAALEGVCYRLADVLDAIGGIESVVATGGALLANAAWLQVLADVLGRPVEVSAVRRGLGARRGARRARAARPAASRRRRSRASSSRAATGTKSIYARARYNGKRSKRGGAMIGIVGGGLAAAKLVEGYREAGGDRRDHDLVAGPARPVSPAAALEAAAARRGRARRTRSSIRPTGTREHDVDLRLGEHVALARRRRRRHDRDRDRRAAAPARRRAGAADARRLARAPRGAPARRAAAVVVVGGGFIGSR